MAHEQTHQSKMCAMTCCPCNVDLEKIKNLANQPKFICKLCGRVANNSENLCSPEPIS